jgi:hypothetical protein
MNPVGKYATEICTEVVSFSFFSFGILEDFTHSIRYRHFDGLF